MSRVIKAGGCGTLRNINAVVRTPVELLRQFQEAEDDARKILEFAERDAMKIVAEARTQVQTVIDEAYEAGYSSGIKRATDDVAPLIARLELEMETVASERDRIVVDNQIFIDSLEDEFLKLCLEIVEKIIKHEIKTDERVVIRMIKSCLRRIKDRGSIDVRLSPEEVAYVREQRDELLSAVEGMREINIIDDRRISPGGCVVESSSGTYDATIETQFNQIAAKIMETFENARNKALTEPDEVS